MIKKAMFFEVLADQEVPCCLCAHACRIKSGRRGVCGIRENREGTLHSLYILHIVVNSGLPMHMLYFFFTRTLPFDRVHQIFEGCVLSG
jgi:hypothetical protein